MKNSYIEKPTPSSDLPLFAYADWASQCSVQRLTHSVAKKRLRRSYGVSQAQASHSRITGICDRRCIVSGARDMEGGVLSPATAPCGLYLELSSQKGERGNLIGINPLKINKIAIPALGHPPSPIKAIRAKCIECAEGSESEARKCNATGCPLWPLRMGRNVYHAHAGGANGQT